MVDMIGDTIGKVTVLVTIVRSDGIPCKGYINKDRHGRFYPSKSHSYHFQGDEDEPSQVKAMKAVNELIKNSDKKRTYRVIDYELIHTL